MSKNITSSSLQAVLTNSEKLLKSTYLERHKNKAKQILFLSEAHTHTLPEERRQSDKSFLRLEYEQCHTNTSTKLIHT